MHHANPPMRQLDAAATAAVLPWNALTDWIARTLDDAAAGRAHAPERMVLPVAEGCSWFVMPSWVAADGRHEALAAIKLITYSAANPGRGLPAIQGDVLVMQAATGVRLAMLDGPTVTARRTAAVSLLAARRLAPQPGGPLLVIGPGVQGEAHARAMAAGLGVREVWVRGRDGASASADALVARLRADGLDARRADDLDVALARCPLVVTATPAAGVVLDRLPRRDAFVAAVGSFSPAMVELAPALVRHVAQQGCVVLDSDGARHEAGDLLAAGLPMAALPTLASTLARPSTGPVLFKSCGASWWDLAAARCAVTHLATPAC